MLGQLKPGELQKVMQNLLRERVPVRDLEAIIELCRPLKLSNFVPTLFRVSNDLYLCGSEGESPEYQVKGIALSSQPLERIEIVVNGDRRSAARAGSRVPPA